MVFVYLRIYLFYGRFLKQAGYKFLKGAQKYLKPLVTHKPSQKGAQPALQDIKPLDQAHPNHLQTVPTDYKEQTQLFSKSSTFVTTPRKLESGPKRKTTKSSGKQSQRRKRT